MSDAEKADIGMPALNASLAKAQSGMGSLAKDAKGNFGKYATLASVIEVVLPPLSDQGIAVIQMPETSADGVTLITMLCHKDGGVLRTQITMKPAQNTPQGIGSTITYARRYSLMAIAGVAPDDDDGTAGSAPQTKERQEQAPKLQANTPDARAFYTKMESMVRAAKTVDDINALYRAHEGEINFSRSKKEILEEFASCKVAIIEQSQQQDAET